VPDARDFKPEWLDDSLHDLERCQIGLPAQKVAFRDPWLQRWWEQYQAELILEVTGLAWDGHRVVHNPEATSISVRVLTCPALPVTTRTA